MATLQENIESMNDAFQTHMKNKNPGVDSQTTANIEEFSLAYATAIANAIGAGTSSIPIGDYIKKTGGADGVMSGSFSSLYGTSLGIGGSRKMSFSNAGVDIYGDISQNTGSYKADGKNVITYTGGSLVLNEGAGFGSVKAYGTSFQIYNELIVGADNISGLYANNTVLKYKNANIWHASNSNLATVSWQMKDALVSGALLVSGATTLSGSLSSLNGFSGGIGGVQKIIATTAGISITGDILINAGSSIKSAYNSGSILSDINNGNVALNGAGKSLLLGYQNTDGVRLASALYNDNGTRKLIDQFGAGSLLWGFNSGTLGVSRFYTDDQGAVVIGQMKVGTGGTALLTTASSQLQVKTSFGTMNIGAESINGCHFDTNTPLFHFKKDVHVTGGYTVYGTSTRLEQNKLLFSSSIFLYGSNDGIKHYGNTYITQNIGTEAFSSGMAGTGWRITADSSATFTNLEVRNKLKVYEFEVEKISAVNGSIWASAATAGDKVVKL